MKRPVLILSLVLVILLAGCAGTKSPVASPDKPAGLGVQKFTDEYTLYTTGPLPIGWHRLWGYDADLAYYNNVHRSTIFVNSTCGVKKTIPTVALRNHLMFDMTDRHIFSHEEVELDMRMGVHTVFQGRMDGALFKAEVYVVQVDHCIYDFAYISTIEQYEACKVDFRKFVMAFHARRKG